MRFTIISAALSLATVVSADILAIDLGSQFFKVALVTTGKFEIVPNLQSKRKTPTAFSVKSKIREFGDDALLAQVKSPGKVASFFRWFIGANLTAKAAESLYHLDMFAPSTVSMDESRMSPIFGSEEFGGQRPIEEIVGNLIWYAKNLVEEHDTPGIGRHKLGSLKDLVITVPSWATKRERQAVIDAANIAGFLKVSLVHETSSAAVQRALDLETELSTVNKTLNVIYLNVGASHFEACVMEYGMLFKSATAKTLGCAHSLKAGGSEITRVLAREAGDAFSTSEEFRSDMISKVRLFRQAEQVKQTLSANKDALFSVESLFEEKDLKRSVSRSDVERIAEPVIAEIEKVISSALARSNLTSSQIDQAEVIGAGWRVPVVQAKLEEMLSPVSLGQHLNGDEATVFGAAYIAANSSSSFRVRKVVFTEASENEYSLKVTPVIENGSIEEAGSNRWPRTQSIFARGSKLNSVKAVKLSALNADLRVEVLENGNLIESYTVSGRNESETEVLPLIILKAKLDSDGIFSLAGAEAVYERIVEEVRTVKIDQPTAVVNNGSTTPEVEGNASENNGTTNATRTEVVKVPKKTKINLRIDSVFQAKPLPMTEDQIRSARADLKAIVEAENSIKLRTKTKNDLEALVYSLRDKMEDNHDVLRHSSEMEREHVVETTHKVEAWLDDFGFNATLDQLKEKINELKKASHDIFDRILKEKQEEERARKLAEEEERKRIKEAEETARKLKEAFEKLALNSSNLTGGGLENITDFLNQFHNKTDLNVTTDSPPKEEEETPKPQEEL